MGTSSLQPAFTGLLSFIYDVSYDAAVQEAFHKDENGVMSKYDLDPEAEALIRQIGAAQTSGQSERAAEDAKTLVSEHLTAELIEKLLPVIW